MDKTRKYYPLRPIQRWLVDTHFNKAKSTMMNIGALYKLSDQIDIHRLIRAINVVLDGHDIFHCRFVFHPETSDLCQTFDGKIEPVKVENMSDEEFSARMDSLREPYKLIDKPLWRIYLIETPSARYLYCDFYHAIMDGVSAVILFTNAFGKVYIGRNMRTPALNYADYVEEEAKIPPDELISAHNYWKKMLAPFDKKKHLPPVDVHGVAAWTQGNLQYKFKKITEEHFRKTRRSENTFFLGATMISLAKITGSNESIMSWIHNGRYTMRERRLMGIMLEQIPCAWDFHEDIPVGEFLNRLEGQINTGIGFRKGLDMVYNDGLEDDCVSFIFQKGFFNDLTVGDGKLYISYLPPNEISAVENALDIEIRAGYDGTYDALLDYDASRYSEGAMSNFIAIMNRILLEMTDETKMISEILR